MQRILYNIYKKTCKIFHIFFITIPLISQSAFVTPVYAQIEAVEIEDNSLNILTNELDGNDVISIPIEDELENNESDPSALDVLQNVADNENIIGAQDENYGVVVDTQVALQEALNSDAAIIKIVPRNGEDYILLDKPLEIYKDRTILITADKPVRIVGASGMWQLITGIEGYDHDISIQFFNVALDGNNVSGGIYNRGTLKIENAKIQNCYHINGGVGIYSIDNLTVNNSLFTNNYANSAYYSDGGGIYARGLKSRCTVNIFNTSFINNTARYGGGVRIDNADSNITNCYFSGNTAIQGPCIYIADATGANVTDCTLLENTGSGAIFVNTSSLTLTNSVVSNNNGRGIYGYAYGNDVNIIVKGNTVISGNAAKTSYGGGIIGYSENGGRVIINVEEYAEIIKNEAVNGGGVSGFPDSNVIINISGNAQIVDNIAYENGGGIYGSGSISINGGQIGSNTAINGGGIYGDPKTQINISNAVISSNIAEQAGGGIWIASLEQLTVDNSTFHNNSALTGYFWRLKSPIDDKQSVDSVIHNESIFNTLYTMPYSNAYNNYDVNYTTSSVFTPYAVTYNGNEDDNGMILEDKNSPYLIGEEVTIMIPPDSLTKKGYRFTGWNFEPDGAGIYYVYYEEDEQFDPPSFTMSDSNIILYAQWEKTTNIIPNPPISTPTPGNPKTIIVTYNGNNDDNGMILDDQNNPYLIGEVVAIRMPPSSLSKAGYRFKGWNTEPDGTGIFYAYDEDNKQFEPSAFTIGDTNVILYAQWDKLIISLPLPEEPEIISNEETEDIAYEPIITLKIDDETENEVYLIPMPEISNELVAQEEQNETIIGEGFTEFPPDYQLAQLDDNIIELVDDNDMPLEQWANAENSGLYYADPNNPQIEFEENGPLEIINNGDTSLGLWSNNEDDEWIYEEYSPINRWRNLFYFFIAFGGGLIGIFFFVITRRHVIRGEFVRMIVHAIHLEAKTENIEPYTDVSEDDIFYYDIMNAKAAGLLSGFPNSKFQPRITITREEIASILAETVRYTNSVITEDDTDISIVFKDFNNINKLFLADIRLLLQLKVMIKKTDDKFDPKGLYTRLQAKKIIKNMLTLISPVQSDNY